MPWSSTRARRGPSGCSRGRDWFRAVVTGGGSADPTVGWARPAVAPAVRRWDVPGGPPVPSRLRRGARATCRAELFRVGLDAGLAAIGVAPAEVFEETRAALVERKRQDLDGGINAPTATPSVRPTPVASCPGQRTLVVGAWSYRSGEDHEESVGGSGPPVGTVARYRTRDHYGSLREALHSVAERLSDLGWRTAVVCDDNALVRPRGGPSGGHRVVRQELAAHPRGVGIVVPPRGGRHRRAPPGGPTRGAGSAHVGLRCLHPLHERLPDRRARCPRRRGCPPLPRVARTVRGEFPRRAPGGARGPHLRMRRLPGRLPDQPHRRSQGTAAAARRRRKVAGRPAGPSRRHRHRAVEPARTLVHPPARPALRATQRAAVALGNVGDSDDPRQHAGPSGTGRGSRTRCSPSTHAGPRHGSVARSPKRRSDPSPRHQRLPTESGWHPVLPLGTLAAARSGFLRGPHRSFPPRTAAAFDHEQATTRDPDRAGPEPGARPHPNVRSAHPRRGGAGRRGARRLRPRLSPSPGTRATVGLPYTVVLHGGGDRGSGAPAGRPAPRPPRLLRQSVLAVSTGSYPAAEARPARCTDAGCPRSSRSRRASTSTGSGPLSPFEKHEARVELGLPSDGPLVVSVSRLVPRKGMDVLIDAAVRLEPDLPGLTVAIAGHGRDADRLSGRSPSSGRRSGCSAGFDDREIPAWSVPPTSSPCVPGPLARIEREGFGIVFVEAAARGSPGRRSLAAGSRVRRSSTARRESWFAGPAEVDGAARAIGSLLHDDGLHSRMGRRRSRRRAEASFGCTTISHLGWLRRSPAWEAGTLSHVRRLGTFGTVNDSTRRADRGTSMPPSASSCRPPRHGAMRQYTDLASVPAWAADIKEVTIDQRDDEGRPKW